MLNTTRWGIALMLTLLLSTATIAQSNQYLDFDGTNDRVIIENASKLIANSNALSMTGWFYCNQLGYGQGMMGFRSGSDGFYFIQLGSGSVECRYVNNGNLYEVVAPNNSVIAQTWQHFTMTYGSNSLKVYIDGVLIGSTSAFGSISDTTLPFGIATHPIEQFNFFFNGRIDEVSLWREELSPSQILDMMSNELVGNEANLELYYKFDQGNANQNNTHIVDVYNFAKKGTYNGLIENMALSGQSSNFGGALDPMFQWIDFPKLPTLVSTGEAHQLETNSSASLPITYTVLSGPATVNGSQLSGNGEGYGLISASQVGNGSFDSAKTVFREFLVVDPANVDANITGILPYDMAIYAVDKLEPLRLSATVDIDYAETFSIEDVSFEIGGQNIPIRKGEENYYYTMWTPTSFGSETLIVKATDNFGKTTIKSIPFEIVQGVSGNTTTVTFDGDHVGANTTFTATSQAELPCHKGVYGQIMAHLTVSCPPGGCDPWDAIVNIEARGFDGKWFRVIRYITPYGTACTHSIDLSDYSSILNGASEFRITYFTSGNGYAFDLDIEFIAGTPAYNYSHIVPLWNQAYDFGNPANLQSTERLFVKPPDESKAATLKLIATGHGWGANNTDNAAEFSHNIHHIHVNGAATFQQDNWLICDPNPSSCSPQAGTWYFDRAGWCPGDIAPYFDYDLSPYISADSIQLDYVFDTTYVDLCHSNHPDCISGTTCANCNDGFNPSLHVLCNLVYYSDEPMTVPFPVGVVEVESSSKINIFPNPSIGEIIIEAVQAEFLGLYDSQGKQIEVSILDISNSKIRLNLGALSSGLYLAKLNLDGQVINKKIVLAK
ncbi:MAG: T9SS type A sorting domain-containing protein [Chitinophagales bacterium]|nr:T9SS type A sorting domain-containing protein [Chitinophagales bacterium]